MGEELTENLNSPNEATEEVANTEGVETEAAQEQVEDVDALKEQNRKLYERAKKAEELAKALKAKVKEPDKAPAPAEKQADVSVTLKDQYALLQANVPADDIDEVLDYAKFKKISITEALKSAVVKATLSERAEQRKTAEVTATGPVKRTSARVTDEQLLQRASKGEFYDLDPEALADADLNSRKKK